MWALIASSNVVEITDTDPNGRFHPSLDWRACGAEVSIGWTVEGDTYSPPAQPVQTAEQLCALVDEAADAARLHVAGDSLRAEEYKTAWAEAQAYKEAGYAGNVPRSVAAWAINGRTPQQAADSILSEAAAYTEALYVIRETRLSAKEQIRHLMASGDVVMAQQLAVQTAANIQAAVVGVGNSTAVAGQ